MRKALGSNPSVSILATVQKLVGLLLVIDVNFWACARVGAFRMMRLQQWVASCHAPAGAIRARQCMYRRFVVHVAKRYHVGCVVGSDFTFAFSHQAIRAVSPLYGAAVLFGSASARASRAA